MQMSMYPSPPVDVVGGGGVLFFCIFKNVLFFCYFGKTFFLLVQFFLTSSVFFSTF